MAECFEKIEEELVELFTERMSCAVWIYSDLFGKCWYCFGILESELVCEGKEDKVGIGCLCVVP